MVAAASTSERSIAAKPSDKVTSGSVTKKMAWLMMAVKNWPNRPTVAQKDRKPSAVMTGGRMNGAMPRMRNTLAQGATRRHRNHDSGRAMATAIAAEVTASVTEWISAARHSGSVKICAYQAAEKPRGGKVSSCRRLTDTPATTMSGAARNSATAQKNRRRAKAFTMPPPGVRPEG